MFALVLISIVVVPAIILVCIVRSGNKPLPPLPMSKQLSISSIPLLDEWRDQQIEGARTTDRLDEITTQYEKMLKEIENHN